MMIRKSNLFFTFLAILLVLLMLTFAHAEYAKRQDLQKHEQMRALLRALPLTDLCLFTEASYTRHWSQADRHTAFQDSPMALEHFPSGSIHLPPAFPGRSHE